MATVDDPRTAPMTYRVLKGTVRPAHDAGDGPPSSIASSINLGLFEDHHVELINGELIELTTNPPHDSAVGLTGHALRRPSVRNTPSAKKRRSTWVDVINRIPTRLL